MSVHWAVTSWAGWGLPRELMTDPGRMFPACRTRNAAHVTTDPSKVTCRRCRQTRMYVTR